MPESDVLVELQAVNQQFEAAVQWGDFQRLRGVYTADAKIFPPSHAAVTGLSGIIQFWEATCREVGATSCRLMPDETILAGDIAYETGRAIFMARAGGMEPKYVVLWQRDATGSWRWHRDIWNLSV